MYTYVYKRIYTYICEYIIIYIYIYIHEYMYPYTCVNVSYVSIYMCECISVYIYICYYFLFKNFSHQPMDFHWSLRDNKCSQVSRTLLSIQCCRLVSLHSSSYFQFLRSLYQSFGDCTERANYNCFYSHFHVPQFFQFSIKVFVLIFLFVFFQFYSVVSWDSKFHNSTSSLFCY